MSRDRKLFRTLTHIPIGHRRRGRRGGGECRNNLIVNWHTNPKQKLRCHWPHSTLADKNSLLFIKVICQKKRRKK